MHPQPPLAPPAPPPQQAYNGPPLQFRQSYPPTTQVPYSDGRAPPPTPPYGYYQQQDNIPAMVQILVTKLHCKYTNILNLTRNKCLSQNFQLGTRGV